MKSPLSPAESIESPTACDRLQDSLSKQRVTNLLGIAGDRHAYQLYIIAQMCLIGFIQSSFANSIPYIFKTPKYMCHNPKGDSWVCERAEACGPDQEFTLFSSIYSINMKYELVCQNEHIVGQSILVILVISGLLSCFLLLFADVFGRKTIFVACCVLQVSGLLGGVLSQNLNLLVAALTVAFTGNYLWFSNSFVYCSEMVGGWARITSIPLLLAACSAGAIFSHAVGPHIPSFGLIFLLYCTFFTLSSFSYIFMEETPFYLFRHASLFKLYEMLSNLVNWNFRGDKKRSRSKLLRHVLFDEDADISDIHFQIHRLNQKEDDIKWDLELNGVLPRAKRRRSVHLEADLELSVNENREQANSQQNEEDIQANNESRPHLEDPDEDQDDSDGQILETKPEAQEHTFSTSSRQSFSVDYNPPFLILNAARLAKLPPNAEFDHLSMPPRKEPSDHSLDLTADKDGPTCIGPNISILICLITIALPVFVGDGLTTLAVQQMGVESVSKAGMLTGGLELIGDLLAFMYSPVISRKSANSISQVLIFVATSMLILLDYNHQSSFNAFSSQGRFHFAEGFCCVLVRLAVSFNMGSLQTYLSELFSTKYRVLAAATVMIIGRIFFGITQGLVQEAHVLDFNPVAIMFFFAIVALPVTYLLPNTDHRGVPN